MVCPAHPRVLVLLGALASASGCLIDNLDYIDPTTASSGDEETYGTTAVETSTGATTTTEATTTTTTTTDATTTTTTTTDATTTDATDTTGDPPFCGDGDVDPGEECDDGNDVNNDECSDFCTSPVCGDEIVQDDEACDHGMKNGEGDDCTVVCQLNVCGDGVLGLSEECEDGNLMDGDGCNKDCKDEECGNGVKDAGEVCDDGNDIDTDACTTLCVPPPLLVNLLGVGATGHFGPGGGSKANDLCAGDSVVIGFAGEYEGINDELANIRSLCVDVKLEPVGAGIFRLRQSGPAVDAMDVHGGAPEDAVPFMTACSDPKTLLWSLGGWTTMTGLAELGLQCAEILVKPINGTYKSFPQAPVMEMPVGVKIGLMTPKIQCDNYPGAFAGGYEVEGDSTITSITFECREANLSP